MLALDDPGILNEALGEDHPYTDLYRSLLHDVTRTAWHADGLARDVREEFLVEQQLQIFRTALELGMSSAEARLFSVSFISLARILSDAMSDDGPEEETGASVVLSAGAPSAVGSPPAGLSTDAGEPVSASVRRPSPW